MAWVLGFAAGSVNLIPRRGRFQRWIATEEAPMSQTVVSTKDALASGSPGQDRHPQGLYILFASEMWERFGFYTAAAMMTLYLQRGGFGWTKTAGDRPSGRTTSCSSTPLRSSAAGWPTSSWDIAGRCSSAASSSSPAMRCSGWARSRPFISPWA